METTPQRTEATAAGEDIASANAQLGIGVALHRQGRYTEAAEAFRQAAAANPASAQAWGNLAVALALCGRSDESLDAAERAAMLAPRVAMLHSNHGDALMAAGRFEAARDAYGRADGLQPDHPATLNKLACAQRMLGELDRPEALFRRALALAPQFGLALVNLGALEAIRCDYDQAASLLGRAIAAPGPDDTRESAVAAMSLVGEHRRLRPALQDAIERDDPAALAAALAATPDALVAVDSAHLARLAAIATALRAIRDDEGAAAERAPSSWPAIEAHFTTHGDAAVDKVRASIDRLEAGAASTAFAGDARSEDLIRIARAVERRRAQRDILHQPADGPAGETLVRYWHAALTWHRPECAPGQFKLLANLTAATPSHRFIAPLAVVGTLRRFFSDIYPTVPPGLARGVLVLRAIGSCHPFFDGNGRTARFLLNAELEAAGRHPVVLFPDFGDRYRSAIAAERANGDVSGFVALLRDSARRAVEIVRVLARSG
ncbi:MAG: tetratricopeptide repeat protein [Casimicrobiaceae bacterium]